MLKKTILGVLKNLKNEEKIELMNFLNGKEEENKASNENVPSNETDELKEEDSEIEESSSVKEEETEENVFEDKTEEESKEEESKEEESKEEDKVDNGAVQTVEPLGNGLRIEDVVMKDELQERLSAMDAKLDALIKENEDLRNQNSSLLEKYENKDFGTTVRKGVPEKGKSADFVSFEEYSKNFM